MCLSHNRTAEFEVKNKQWQFLSVLTRPEEILKNVCQNSELLSQSMASAYPIVPTYICLQMYVCIHVYVCVQTKNWQKIEFLVLLPPFFLLLKQKVYSDTY